MRKNIKTAAVLAVTVLTLFSSAMTFFAAGYAGVRNPTKLLRGFYSPSVMVADVTTSEKFNSIPENSPAVAIFTYENGSVTDSDGNILSTAAEAYARLENKVVPAFRVESPEDVGSFNAFVSEQGLDEGFIVSSSEDIITEVREAHGKVLRGVYDMSDIEETLSESELAETVKKVNRMGAGIVILPYSVTGRAEVRYLQMRLISVWSVSEGGESETAAYFSDLLLTGAIGAVIENRALLEQVMIKMSTRKGWYMRPFVIGHRGTGNNVEYPENSIEGAFLAIENGADMVEIDFYSTVDGVIVAMHDSTIDRTTNGSGNITQMTYEELSRYQLDCASSGYVCDIPTLDAFLEAFKESGDVLVIEIKQGGIAERIAARVKEFGMESQVVVIAFSASELASLKKAAPELPAAFLTGKNSSDPIGSFYAACNLNCYGINSSYSGIESTDVFNMKVRGFQVWTWTYGAAIDAALSNTTQTITTDVVTGMNVIPDEVYTDCYEYTVRVGEKLSPLLYVVRRDLPEPVELDAVGSGIRKRPNVIEGDDVVVASNSDCSFTAVKTGVATVNLHYLDVHRAFQMCCNAITVTVLNAYGDVDLSGTVPDIADSLLLFKHVAGTELLSEDALALADMNADMSVNLGDSLQLFRYVAGVL